MRSSPLKRRSVTLTYPPSGGGQLAETPTDQIGTPDILNWRPRTAQSVEAAYVQFARADIMKVVRASKSAPPEPEVQTTKRRGTKIFIGHGHEVQTTKRRGTKIFIGHGHSLVWYELKNFLADTLKLQCDEYNAKFAAGIPTVTRLNTMLDDAAFAFLVLTAENRLDDGAMQARMNVIHEAGLFQARLGFEKAILLLEDGCEEFSNIHGLGYIPFPKGSISSKFEDVRRVLQREGLVP